MSELRLVLTAEPKCEPVTTDEAKEHARIDETADNGLVTAMLYAARQACENYTRRAFITQSYTLFLDGWPDCPYVELPCAPLISVTHVKTYDDADVATTWSASNYYVDVATKPGRLVLRSAASWPAADRVANAIEVLFKAGYGDSPDNVPYAIKQAILETFVHFYEHRGDANAELPETAQILLASYKTWLV